MRKNKENIRLLVSAGTEEFNQEQIQPWSTKYYIQIIEKGQYIKLVTVTQQSEKMDKF